MSNIFRDVTLDQITEADIDKELRIAGWVENIRDHGGVSFLDIRDMYAIMQVVIRDGNTLQPLPMGRVGLVNLITPLLNATPVTSVMTDDLGMLTPGQACGCGLQSPYLTILGRAGLRDITTCAAGASELLGL